MDSPDVDLQQLAPPTQKNCNLLPEYLCDLLLRDPFTAVLATWIALQMIWVTMLLVTQLFLIARAQTTWESMRGHTHHTSRTSEAVTSVVTAGSTTMEAAGLSEPSAETRSPAAAAHQARHSHEGCFARWKKLLGLDSFIATASGKTAKASNPFSRGVIQNCQDFWCDPAPYLTMRENGAAMLDGQIVNYNMIYEPPSRTRTRTVKSGNNGGVYHSIGDEDNV